MHVTVARSRWRACMGGWAWYLSKYISYTYHTSASAPQTRRAAASAPPATRTAPSPSPRGQSVRNSIRCDRGACRPVMARNAQPTGSARSVQPVRPPNRPDHPPLLAHPPRRQPFGPLSGLPASTRRGGDGSMMEVMIRGRSFAAAAPPMMVIGFTPPRRRWRGRGEVSVALRRHKRA